VLSAALEYIIAADGRPDGIAGYGRARQFGNGETSESADELAVLGEPAVAPMLVRALRPIEQQHRVGGEKEPRPGTLDGDRLWGGHRLCWWARDASQRVTQNAGDDCGLAQAFLQSGSAGGSLDGLERPESCDGCYRDPPTPVFEDTWSRRERRLG